MSSKGIFSTYGCKIAAVVLAVISAGLIIGGFFVPPVGVINSSVLTGVGELIALAVLFLAWHAIDKGMDAKLTHGSTSLEVTNDEADK